MLAKRQKTTESPSKGQHLTSKDARCHSCVETPGSCWISRLPDEILFDIFTYLPRYIGKERFQNLFVCKAWRRVYERIVFREIRFTVWLDDTELSSRLQNLFDILQARPYIQAYPRTLHLSDFRDDLCARLLISILGSCTTIREVSFHGNFKINSPKTRELLHAIKCLSPLEHLYFRGRRFSGPSFPLLSTYFTSPTLKSVHLSRFGASHVDRPLHPTRPSPSKPLSQSDLEKVLPPARYRTGSVTSLHLETPHVPPHVTEHMLRWPTRLTELSIIGLCQSNYRTADSYTTQIIQTILHHHRNSLERVTIGNLLRSTNGIPDFSSFPCLKELNVSAWNLIKFETASDAVTKLSAPNLRCVSMDFLVELPERTGSSVGLRPNCFGEVQATWIKDFARLKKAQYPNNKLERMIIEFHPDTEPCFPTGLRAVGRQPNFERIAKLFVWPWEYIQQAKELGAGFGLTVDFSAQWTKQEWYKIIRDGVPSILEVIHPGHSLSASSGMIQNLRRMVEEYSSSGYALAVAFNE